MGSFINTIKRFVANKNTVTIVGVIAGVLVLWGFYTWRVGTAITPTKVPYALKAIGATEQIKEDDIGWIEVNSKFLSKVDIIREKNQLVGKYVTTGTSIPVGGLFYTKQVVKKEELPNTIFDNIEDGHTISGIKVDIHTTYGNSIYPGDKIDLYLKAVDDNNKIIFGKFIEKITVLDVRDNTGRPVFDTQPPRTPAQLLFSVDDDYYELLSKAKYINGVTIVPVPRNKNYNLYGEVKTFGWLKNFILTKSFDIPDE